MTNRVDRKDANATAKKLAGTRFRLYREIACVSIARVSAELGVSSAFICNVEAGLSWLPDRYTKAIAHLFGLKIESARELQRASSYCKKCNGTGIEFRE